MSEPDTGWRSAGPGGGGPPPGPAGTPAMPGSADGGPSRPMITIGSYPEYSTAQRVVDHLADQRFPVEHTRIVGTELKLVETVLGRLTTGRAALAGAASGAWFGLFIGLLFGIFAVANWVGVVLTAVVVGAVWGLIFGAVAHGMRGGRRDFSSTSSLQAGRYAVNVDADLADRARQLLAGLTLAPTPTAS
ncbi:MAG TPA: general stress protein [Micromonosporaceae bacterium]|nr:general stress protein [Micromonosporaceae bacterium]